MHRVARQLLEVVAETFNVAHVGAANADGVGRDVLSANEVGRNAAADGIKVLSTRVVASKNVGTLVEAVSEGHHRDVDEVFGDACTGEAVETRVDGMVEDGAVLHGETVDETFEVRFGGLVQEAERHGVEVTVEPDDAEIKAFFCWCVVFGLRLSATAERGEHNGKRHGCHGDEVSFHIR